MPSSSAITGAVAATTNALANRRTLNPSRRRSASTPTYGGAARSAVQTQGGRQGIVGRGGNFQELGAAARRRLSEGGAPGVSSPVQPPPTAAPKPGMPTRTAMRPQGEKPMAPMGPEAVGVQGEKPLMPPEQQIERLPGPPMVQSGGGFIDPAQGAQMRDTLMINPRVSGPNPPQMGGIPEGLTRGIPPELMQRIQQLRAQGGPVGMNGGGLQGLPPQMGGAQGPGGIVGPGAVAQPTPQPPAYNPWGSGGGAGGPVGLDAFYRMAR